MVHRSTSWQVIILQAILILSQSGSTLCERLQCDIHSSDSLLYLSNCKPSWSQSHVKKNSCFIYIIYQIISKNLIKKSEIISVTQFRRPILILRRAHVPKATSCEKNKDWQDSQNYTLNNQCRVIIAITSLLLEMLMYTHYSCKKTFQANALLSLAFWYLVQDLVSILELNRYLDLPLGDLLDTLENCLV